MILKVGLVLLCNFNFYGINSYRVRLLNVPTTVLAITEKITVVEYDLGHIQNFQYLHSDAKLIETVDKADITSNYMNCKEKK